MRTHRQAPRILLLLERPVQVISSNKESKGACKQGEERSLLGEQKETEMQLPTSILLLVFSSRPAAEGRPNIVFVLADDLGWGDVGWNNPSMADVTPHLTKLAKYVSSRLLPLIDLITFFRSGMVLSQYYVQQVSVQNISRDKLA